MKHFELTFHCENRITCARRRRRCPIVVSLGASGVIDQKTKEDPRFLSTPVNHPLTKNQRIHVLFRDLVMISRAAGEFARSATNV